jgi:hypothetical protein
MPLVDRLESKYGWIAIPGIVRILVAFQLLMFLLIYLRQDVGFALQLALDPGLIMRGEVWRAVSFVILPPTLSALGMVFVVFFTIFLGDMLERLWGSFRLTLYVIGGIVGILLGAFLAYLVVGPLGYKYFAVRIGLEPWTGTHRFLWVTMILAAVAVLNPNQIINIMGVIPVKIMWIAIFAGGVIFIDLVQLTRVHFLLGVSLLIAVSNFLIVFGPSTYRQVRQRGEVVARRRQFDIAKMPESESLHHCESCGKTEHDDPELEFRVAADGEEYCADHLPGRSGG